MDDCCALKESHRSLNTLHVEFIIMTPRVNLEESLLSTEEFDMLFVGPNFEFGWVGEK